MKSVFFISLLLLSSFASADLVLYSDRPETINKMISAGFTAKTGVNVKVVSLKPEQLIAQLQSEGATTNKADVILVKDLVYLNQLQSGGFFQKYDPSKVPNAAIVADTMKNEKWVALTYRARSVAYNTISVNPADLKDYSSLGDQQWAGRLCVRSSNSTYNQALVANFIAQTSLENTTQLLKSWVHNFAMDPIVNDETILASIKTGDCDIGVVNSYYVAKALAADPQAPIGFAFVGQSGSGTHTNGSGIGISAASQQVELAQTLINTSLSPEIQDLISGVSLEFPANQTVAHSNPTVNSWRGFKMNTTPWSSLGDLIPKAVSAMSNAGYSDGKAVDALE